MSVELVERPVVTVDVEAGGTLVTVTDQDDDVSIAMCVPHDADSHAVAGVVGELVKNVATLRGDDTLEDRFPTFETARGRA